MPEFQALQPEQDEWKRAVLAGEIELEDISTEGVTTAVMAANPDIVRANPADGPRAGTRHRRGDPLPVVRGWGVACAGQLGELAGEVDGHTVAQIGRDHLHARR